MDLIGLRKDNFNENLSGGRIGKIDPTIEMEGTTLAENEEWQRGD